MPTVTADLGPITEARFAKAFAERALIGRQDAARLLGIELKTFDALGLPTVARGTSERAKGYTERDLRAYLTAQLAPRPTPSKPRPHRSGSGKVLRFSERH